VKLIPSYSVLSQVAPEASKLEWRGGLVERSFWYGYQDDLQEEKGRQHKDRFPANRKPTYGKAKAATNGGIP
jgi:hypothetical protein